LDIDWADGLAADSNLIRRVGAPAEITPARRDLPLAIVTTRTLQMMV
jgi:hypothetical protein